MIFIKYKNFKKLQREVNHEVKLVNRAIYDDPLWRGRFYLRQKKCLYHEFEDKSGAYLNICLTAFDKKTTQYYDYYLCHSNNDSFFLRYHLNIIINDFIVKQCNVWEQDVSPYNDFIDYKKVER